MARACRCNLLWCITSCRAPDARQILCVARKDFVAKSRIEPRAKPREQTCRQHGRRHVLGHGRLDGPTPFAGILHNSREVIEPGIGLQRGRE